MEHEDKRVAARMRVQACHAGRQEAWLPEQYVDVRDERVLGAF